MYCGVVMLVIEVGHWTHFANNMPRWCAVKWILSHGLFQSIHEQAKSQKEDKTQGESLRTYLCFPRWSETLLGFYVKITEVLVLVKRQYCLKGLKFANLINNHRNLTERNPPQKRNMHDFSDFRPQEIKRRLENFGVKSPVWNGSLWFL